MVPFQVAEEVRPYQAIRREQHGGAGDTVQCARLQHVRELFRRLCVRCPSAAPAGRRPLAQVVMTTNSTTAVPTGTSRHRRS